MRYKAIIKRVISPALYTKLTGIDLSHTDTSVLKCVEIEERPIIASTRAEAFSAIIPEVWHEPFSSLSIVKV